MRFRFQRLRNLLLIVFILFASPVFGQTEYYASSAPIVAWNAVSGADHYEIVIMRDNGQTWNYTTSNTQLSLTKPRSGKFTIEVRAVASDGTKSNYCLSTDNSCSLLMDGSTAGGWKILWRPSAPTGPIE